MTKFAGKYRIESNRWQYWDYSAPGSYFITICIDKHRCILGKVHHDKMEYSDFGLIVKNELKELTTYHPRISKTIYQVMPNHLHFLITLGDYNFNNGLMDNDGTNGNNNDGRDGDGRHVDKIHEFHLPPNPTNEQIEQYRKQRRQMIIPKICGKFQMLTSKHINQLRQTPGTKNWQANYHDHVVRNNGEYQRIKNYIINNPKKWDEDKFRITE